MAIPTPPAIYLPADLRWQALGEALGKLGGSVATGYNQADALAQAKDMPPDQQAQYLMSRLGPEGMKFVQTLADLKRSQAEVARAGAETQSAITVNKLNEDKLAHAQELRDLTSKKADAEIAAERASAAGSYASAARSRAEAAEAGTRAEMLRKQMALTESLTGEALKTFGGMTNAPPRVQPQSFETPGAGQDQGASPKPLPIAAGSSEVITPGGGGQPTQVDQTGPATRLQFIDDVTKGVDPAADIPPVQLTPAERTEILGHFAKLDIAGAGKAMQEATQPKSTFDLEIAPGIIVKAGLYGDGKTRPFPGTIQDKRKPADTTLREVSAGASLWANTSQILKNLSEAEPGTPTGDVLGNRAVRQLNQVLQNHGMEPVGDKDTRDIREAYKTIYDHNMIGIISLMKGARQTQQLRGQLQDTAPKPTDAKEIRQQKFKATQLTAEIFIKNEVETAMDGGMKVPPLLLSIYKDMGLENRDIGDLRKDYLDTFKGLGVSKPVTDFSLATPEEGIGGGGSGGSGGDRGGTPLGDTGGWSIQRVGP